MGGISSKAFARLENKKQYNSIEHTTDLDLNQYDAFFRNLDPQIGRFIQIDPETESQENVSPFESMGNNPILNVDPLGDFKTRFGAWWHSLWHGGTVGKNSNGEYFVSKPIETESSEDGSVTVGVSVAYGKGRHALSAAGERMQAENNKQVFEDRMLNMGIWQRHETVKQANEATFKNSVAMLLPNVIRAVTSSINASKEIQTTAHGSERIAGAAATRGGVLSPAGIKQTKQLGKVFTQPDGATVYLYEVKPGKFNAVVENTSGKIVTTMENWSQKSITRIAKNYGWPIE